MFRQFQGLDYSEVRITNTLNSLLLTGLLEGRTGERSLPSSCIVRVKRWESVVSTIPGFAHPIPYISVYRYQSFEGISCFHIRILKQGRQCSYKRNTEASSCKHCRSGNKCYVFCSLSHSAQTTPALYCHLWPFRLYDTFPHYLINVTI
jgi:hypothetical protein